MRHRLTSDLTTARNDTGRIAYCGPVVLAAITDFPVSRIEHEIRAVRDDATSAEQIIKGTTTQEVRSALGVFGYEMCEIANFHDLERKLRPTVWSWMQRPRSAFSYYVLAIHKGREGHWICVRGTKMCDTFTGGDWVFVSDGPHRGARIMEIYVARRAAG
ncbi:MAG: hypothetical protein AAFZ01_06150 [Pseudomonadota bacterium]